MWDFNCFVGLNRNAPPTRERCGCGCVRAAWCGTRVPVCECKVIQELNVADLGQSHL